MMAKSQCSKAFPSNKIDYQCRHTTYEGNHVQLGMYITTLFIQKLQSRQEGGRKICIVLAAVGGRKGDLSGRG